MATTNRTDEYVTIKFNMIKVEKETTPDQLNKDVEQKNQLVESGDNNNKNLQLEDNNNFKNLSEHEKSTQCIHGNADNSIVKLPNESKDERAETIVESTNPYFSI